MITTGSLNPSYRESYMLQAELEELRIRIKAMQETNETLKARNVQLLFEKQSTASLTESSNLNGLLFSDTTHSLYLFFICKI